MHDESAAQMTDRPRHWWVTEKLMTRFPEAAPSRVLEEVLDGFRSAELFGLAHAEEAAMAESLAAERLARAHT